MKKQKYTLEFLFNASPKVLYNRLSTPTGLAEWFADDVNFENNMQTFVFSWSGEEERADIISKKELSHIKFLWQHEDDEQAYFEFRINVDDLTKDVMLVVTDFAEPDEIDDAIQLWNKQIEDLKNVLGS